MGILKFQSNFKSPKLDSLDLPVEIRKPNLALVARTVLSKSLEIEPGIYNINVKLPAGHELFRQIKVGKKGAKVILAPEQEEQFSSELDEELYFMGGQPSSASQAEQLESLGGEVAEAKEAKLRLFVGNPLTDGYHCQEMDGGFLRQFSSFTKQNKVIQFDIRGDYRVRLLQLLQPQQPAINVALPTLSHIGCTCVLTQLPNGLYSLDVSPMNQEANLLLQYQQRGYFQEAEIAATSKELTPETAEEILRQKGADPIAATVGAYALLSFGKLEQLHDWTENLKNWFPFLPDGVAIRGEHLARLGEHEQALTVFLALPERGLPLFSTGLSYTLDRLRLYVSVGQSHFQENQISQAQTLLEKLQRFANFVDFRRPILTFTGIDPNQPNDELLDEDIASYNGLDVTQIGEREFAIV